MNFGRQITADDQKRQNKQMGAKQSCSFLELVRSCAFLKEKIRFTFLLLLPMTTVREGNGTPLQFSCLENLMDGGAWWAAVHGSLQFGHD